jgi:hypothetical protein
VPEDKDLQPGESATFSGDVPWWVDKENLQAVISFACGNCNQLHEASVPALAGGEVSVDCPCGAKIKLLVGPTRFQRDK